MQSVTFLKDGEQSHGNIYRNVNEFTIDFIKAL